MSDRPLIANISNKLDGIVGTFATQLSADDILKR